MARTIGRRTAWEIWWSMTIGSEYKRQVTMTYTLRTMKAWSGHKPQVGKQDNVLSEEEGRSGYKSQVGYRTTYTLRGGQSQEAARTGGRTPCNGEGSSYKLRMEEQENIHPEEALESG